MTLRRTRDRKEMAKKKGKRVKIRMGTGKYKNNKYPPLNLKGNVTNRNKQQK
jgi:hypothetical protein